nr:uncharacterized protein LOC131789865 [Pocillopora verrucosa]
MMEGETIFVQTDPAFQIVLDATNELRDRLQVTHFQTAVITDIESNHQRDDHRFVFDFVSFGRTASAVVRMCMLEAVGVSRKFWPNIGPYSYSRNKNKLEREVIGPLFCLANDRNTARHYWCKYDQLYPHFRIEDAFSGLDINQQENMSSMMLILRNNFAELIEIITTFTARRRAEHRFNSYVHVTCIVREIQEGKDGPYTIRLKELVQPLNISVEYFDRVMKIRSAEDAQNLPSPLGDEDDESEANEGEADESEANESKADESKADESEANNEGDNGN